MLSNHCLGQPSVKIEKTHWQPGSRGNMLYLIFQKRVRVFHRGFKHEKTDESTRPQAECFYCFRVFETTMKLEARVFEINSPTKEN